MSTLLPEQQNALRNEKGQFILGNIGNPLGAGRPKGARSKLGEAFLEALAADFEANGLAALERCRTESPVAYIRVVASILPREFDTTMVIDQAVAMSQEELDARVRRLLDEI